MTTVEQHDPSGHVAVIGLAGRFPGARDVTQFWSNLCQATESLTVFDDQRDPTQPEYVPAYGVLPGADEFDADFFGYSPNEALILDPQHRQLLECAQEALERAGHGGRDRPVTGVFVGGAGTNYGEHVRAWLQDLPFVDEWQIRQSTGIDFLSSRIAYQFNLTGPALTVQTACSTSLVAVHVAIGSLLAGDCDMALAGGVSVLAGTPRLRYTPGGITAPDGHCRAFDADSAGTVSASAVGLVVLRPLADALADGDHVHAVIRGSAVNNDGRDKIGFTAPSVGGQAEAVRAAQAAAGVQPQEIGYVEAHGTATALGDPIEVAALTKAFGLTGPRRRCLIGSVKTNVGHTDAAAGIVGLIKTVLAVEHGILPPSLHFRRPNPAIDFTASPFEVNAELRTWPEWATPRIAATNALGIGGTNAHVVVAEAPARVRGEPGRSHHLIVLSHRTADGVVAAGRRLADHLAGQPEVDLADVAWSLKVGRTAYPHRWSMVCTDPTEAVTKLRAFSIADVTGQGHAGRPVFLFPGQGGQYVGMGSDLYRQEPAFRQAIDEVAELAQPSLGLDLRQVLFPAVERRAAARQRLADIAVGQPAVFAIQHAMRALLAAWGVRPGAVLGHSLGAFGAAEAAGVLSTADAVHLVIARGRLLGTISAGGMAAVRLPEAELTPLLPDGVSIGAINGPRQCTVSGPADRVARFAREQAETGVEARVLRIGAAGHSALVEPILEQYADLLAGLTLHHPQLPVLSDTTGDWATSDELSTVDYWVRHLRQPIRFGPALAALFATGPRVLLDLGPGRTLQSLAIQHPDREHRHVIVHAMPHPAEGGSDLATALAAAGRMWAAGTGVDLRAQHAGEHRRRTALPTYPFRRRRYFVPAPSYRLAERADGPLSAAWVDDATPACDAPTTVADQAHPPALTALLQAFRTALGRQDVAADDSFHDLGGDSLTASKIAAWARTRFAVPVTGADLLRARTAAALADIIAARIAEPGTGAGVRSGA